MYSYPTLSWLLPHSYTITRQHSESLRVHLPIVNYGYDRLPYAPGILTNTCSPPLCGKHPWIVKRLQGMLIPTRTTIISIQPCRFRIQFFLAFNKSYEVNQVLQSPNHLYRSLAIYRLPVISVVITTTPLAPRIPYIAAALASFSKVIVSTWLSSKSIIRPTWSQTRPW